MNRSSLIFSVGQTLNRVKSNFGLISLDNTVPSFFYCVMKPRIYDQVLQEMSLQSPCSPELIEYDPAGHWLQTVAPEIWDD